jgi:hypothetical protein
MGAKEKSTPAQQEQLLREAIPIGQDQIGGGNIPVPPPVNRGARQESLAPLLDGPIDHAPIKVLTSSLKNDRGE